MDYLKSGINCIAVDGNKRAIRPWKKYQTQMITEAEFESQMADAKAKGVAVICGKISGNLGILDIDAKYDLSGSLWSDFLDLLPDYLKPKLYIVETKNNGYHIYYFCEALNGNTKLAQRYTTDQERKDTPHDKVRVLIETREEGGYAVAPPTVGYKIAGALEIPTITAEERQQLFEAARSFNQVYDEVRESKAQVNDGFSLSPFDDYNKRGQDDMINRLVSAGWKVVTSNSKKVVFLRPGKTESKSSGDFNYDKNWFCVFTTSSEFEPLKAYKPAAVFCKLECRDNWQDCARKLIELGYGEQKKFVDNKLRRDIFRKRQEGANNDEIAAYLTHRHGIGFDTAKDQVSAFDAQLGEKICTFWEVSEKGIITIVRHKMQKFLSEVGGFYLYYYDKRSPIYKIIRVVDGFVDEATSEHLKKFVKEYIEGLPDTFDGISGADLLEVVYKGAETYFSKSLLEFMPRIELNLLKDTPQEAFYPFKNGVLKITSDKKELLKYGEVGLHVWRNRVIDFNIDIDEQIDWTAVEFVRFLDKICDDDFERFKYVISLIGYLLHGYKISTRPYAIICAEETESEKEGGGTGKGIFFKAISKLLDTVTVDGKNFRLDKSFAFQRVELSTQLIVVEDCRKGIDLEGFYSHLTEGVTVEKKNKDELYIPYADAPKFGFTTNYTIQINGNHGKRRAKVIEFSSFFHPKNTPLDFFGHQLFEDWDKDEWNRFYNMMAECVQSYLINGVVEVKESQTMKRKSVKLQFGEEFLDFFENINVEEWHLFNEKYLSFLDVSGQDKKEYSSKRFKAALRFGCEKMGYTLEEQNNSERKKEFKIH
jgi:hypothetical protein